MTVVHDGPDELVLWRWPGAVSKRRNATLTGPRNRFVAEWREGFSDAIWQLPRCALVIKGPRTDYSVSLFLDEPGKPAFSYVDLTSPLERTPAGFDFVEHLLDIVVPLDFSSWSWKDDDEMEWAVEHGLYARGEARRLREEGERAADRLFRDRAMFERWLAWRPDPHWSPATLPNDWDEQE